jgi:hypothetical protein
LFGFLMEPAVRCNCHQRIAIPPDVVRQYLHGHQAVCPQCGSTGDWWSTLLDTVKGVMTVPLAVIGAHQTVLQPILRRERETVLDFNAAGVPEDARILRVYYTAEGSGDEPPLFPLQTLSSHPEPPWIPRKVTIYPHVSSSGTSVETSKLNVLVAWLPADESDAAQPQLVAAFDAYTRGGYEPFNYDQFVIPANTAVEVALGRLTASWLGDHASAEHVRRFLNDAATYSHQLNILLPVMVRSISGPPLPDHIRGALNRLRSLRNQLAHSGVPNTPIDKSEAAECLCAAFFGVEYVRTISQLYASAT